MSIYKPSSKLTLLEINDRVSDAKVVLMTMFRKTYLSILNRVVYVNFLFLITSIPTIAEAASFIVTGHVYANKNDFEYILEFAKKNDIEEVFLLGDIEAEILDNVDYYENAFDLEIISVLGNHEVPWGKDNPLKYSKLARPRASTRENTLNLFLNSMDRGGRKFSHQGYSISGEQFEFVKRAITEAGSNVKNINLFLHHALFLDGFTPQEQQKFAKNSKFKLDLEAIQLHSKTKGFDFLLSNNLASNNWHNRLGPIFEKALDSGKTINVFAGDGSLSVQFKHQDVNYFVTGLRQAFKPAFHTDNLQSFFHCLNDACEPVFFQGRQFGVNSQFSKFKYRLNKLLASSKSASIEVDFSQNNQFELSKIEKIGLLHAKKQSDCKWPESITFSTGSGEKIKRQKFQGLELQPNQKLFLLDRNDEFLNRKKIKVEVNEDPSICKSFSFHFKSFEVIGPLLKDLPPINETELLLEKRDLEALRENIPDEKTRYDRFNKFSFPEFKAQVPYVGGSERVKLKIRGGTKFHWGYQKKSYSVDFKNDELRGKLFYIPEKRAIFGEALVHEIANDLGLLGLLSSYEQLKINGQDQGTYFVLPTFDKYFLLKHDLPEGNIYHTDSFAARLAGMNNEKMKPSMFVGEIKSENHRFKRDIEHFIRVITLPNDELRRNWHRYFDKQNLSKILALHLATGTWHYDFHSLYFYLNPTNGKIYFIPWDFMNFANAESIITQQRFPQWQDYMNVNAIFTKLLEIPEIRFMRNQYMYDSGDLILNSIFKFEDQKLTDIMKRVIADKTIPLNFDNGNKSLLSFLHIPETIRDNIAYQNALIASNNHKAEFDIVAKTDRGIALRSSFLAFNGLLVDNVVTFYKGIEQESVHLNKVLYSETTTKEEFFAPILVKRSNATFEVQNKSNNPIDRIEVRYRNPVTLEVLGIATIELEKNKQTEKSVNQAETITLKNPAPDLFIQAGNKFRPKQSTFEVINTIEFPEASTLEIPPGTTIVLDQNASIISYGKILAKGTVDAPINIGAKDLTKPWGVIATIGERSSAYFSNCSISNGSGAYHNGVFFSGMISSYHTSSFIMDRCTLKFAKAEDGGDDALNVKFSNASISNSVFRNNAGDAIDFDFVEDGSSISQTIIRNNNNDGIDISSSHVLLVNNEITRNTDKGLSLGESASALIEQNNISNNHTGIAIKDGSNAVIKKSKIDHNLVGLAVYRKKPFFDAPSLNAHDSLVEKNYLNCGIDQKYLNDDENGLTINISNVKSQKRSYKYVIENRSNEITKKRFIKAVVYENGLDKWMTTTTLKPCIK